MNHILEFEQFGNLSPIFEEVKQGAKGDPYEYKKEGDKYFTRKKGAPNWILAKGDVAKSIQQKIFSPVSPLKFEPYKLTSGKYDTNDVRSQRDTFAGYRDANIKTLQTGELKAQQMARGIVPMKPTSGIQPHYRIFGDFLKVRKEPVTSKDFTREELITMKDMIQTAKPSSQPKNVNFPDLAKIHFSKVKSGQENQLEIDAKKSIAYVLGNAQVADKGNYYQVKDIYDFNNFYNSPDKYSLKNMPSTVGAAFKKLFSGNLVQGVEELASYYQKLGYKGIPVSIDIPKNLA